MKMVLKVDSLNRHSLKENEIFVNHKQIFTPRTLKMWEIYDALIKTKGFTSEDVVQQFRTYDSLMPYFYSLIKIFEKHNEAVIRIRRFDVGKVDEIIRSFERAFNCKLPYGKHGENYVENGKELVKFVLVKDLW